MGSKGAQGAPASPQEAYRRQKKAWDKKRRRAVRPFKGLAVLFLVVFCVANLALAVLNLAAMTFDLITDSSRYEVVNEDPDAVFWESEFATDEERVAAGDELSEQVEAEGATLLKNEGDALPLASGAKVTLFSHSSVDMIYGGTGSAGLDTSQVLNLREALEEQGLEVNPTMWDFYETGAGSAYERIAASATVATEGDSYAANEVPWDVYDEATLASVADYGDAAIMVISRVGGEGADLPYELETGESGGYLGLSNEERELLSQLKAMKDAGDVDKIVVLVNSSNGLQLDFLDDTAYGVDACLQIGGVGKRGISAVAKILAGEVNPSGRLADTLLVDNLSSPAMANFGSWQYANAEEAGLADTNENYVIYQEGIYVGYRYYETRYEDYVMGTAGAGSYDYAGDVARPFGFGLSYTDFAYSDFSASYNRADDAYEVTVTVTNTGDVAGKHTVQVWGQSPYTAYDQKNGIEKSAVALVGFGKTKLLEPGESQTLTVTVDRADLAAYDANGAGTYVMDAGDYYLAVGRDAHDGANNILAAKGFSPDSTDGRMDAAGDADLVFGWTEDKLDTTTYATSDVTGAAIENRFDDADLNRSSCTGDQGITYLSRSDWEGTFPTEVKELTATDEMVAELQERRYDPDTYDGAYAGVEMPTQGAKGDVQLKDLIGADFDDPRWDDLIDQLSAEDMAFLLGSAFHYTQPMEQIGLPGTRDENGPTGLTTTLFGGKSDWVTMGLPSEDVMGATYNTELMGRVGEVIGEDCLAVGMSFLYGPGANIHRTPYAGRNFEYFSEDGYLSGALLAAECTGIESKGTHVMIKHFAMNDQETDRIGISVWANEQSIREIYLRAFEDAFTEGTATGVMTSYTRIGCHWNGSNEGMIAGVLRGEWGCNGVVISDNTITYQYMYGPDALLAQSDIFDSMLAIEHAHLLEYTDDPVIVSAMRDATHRLCYQIANSNAMNGFGENTTVREVTPGYLAATEAVWGVALVGFAACFVLDCVRSVSFRRANPKPKKRDFA